MTTAKQNAADAKVTEAPVEDPHKSRVVETTTGELIPIRPADTSFTAPIGNFLSGSTPGIGKYINWLGILSGAALAVHTVLQKILERLGAAQTP